MNNFWSNVGTWIKTNRSEILTTVGVCSSIAAVGFAYKESEKARYRVKKNKETLDEIKKAHDAGDYTDAEYRKVLAKQLAKTAGNAAYDMKGTLICEGVAVTSLVASCVLGRKAYKGAAALASTALAYSAMLENGIKDQFGEEALRNIQKKPYSIKKISKKNEDGTVEEEEVKIESPMIGAIDTKAEELCRLTGYPYSIGTILLDNRFSAYKSVGGKLEDLIRNLKFAQTEANNDMWMSGKNKIKDTLDCLGLFASEKDSFNMDLAEMIGTVDTPTAFDVLSNKPIKVPGFDDEGRAVERYGEYSHKYLSFGEELDKVINDYLVGNCEEDDVERRLSYQMVTDPRDNKQYILLDLSYDGNIANIVTSRAIVNERMASAWDENPEMLK